VTASAAFRPLHPFETEAAHTAAHSDLAASVYARASTLSSKRSPARDPVKDHVTRGAEQNDRVETVVELRLVPHASLNEQRATIIGVQD
jgi:hypothetical protein